MSGTPGRILRLVAASVFIPFAAWASYVVARYIDGNPATIDNNGSGVGVIMVVASVFAASRLASDDQWSERAGISLGLSAAFFVLSWVEFGDASLSADSAPHIVWYGLCVAAFAPAVVVVPLSQWAWSSLRIRRGFV